MHNKCSSPITSGLYSNSVKWTALICFSDDQRRIACLSIVQKLPVIVDWQNASILSADSLIERLILKVESMVGLISIDCKG